MGRSFFVTGIELVPVSERLPLEFSVEGLCLTNDLIGVEPFLSPGFRQKAGQFEVDFLLAQASLVAYQFTELGVAEPPEKKHQALLAWLFRVRRLLQALWLVKDNAACNEYGYLEWPHAASPALIWRNFWGGVVSKADSSRTPVEFTGDEIRLAGQLYGVIVGHIDDEIAADQPRLSRWNTALYFVEAARLAQNPGLKVANYCTSLEALFATDAQELTHKLSERVACFLESDGAQRVRVFTEMKAAYALRSKIVHGDKRAIDKGLQSQVVATTCDETLRRILRKILGDPELVKRFIEGRDKDSEDYFTSMVFGARRMDDGTSLNARPGRS